MAKYLVYNCKNLNKLNSIIKQIGHIVLWRCVQYFINKKENKFLDFYFH